ncbi:hypothetical protein [Dysgonomonas sp. 216]|uniref:hypothetical protein n=1 Tax=Dysgonomonas sp. 216 TaxID=2302934 RepID=UPI0013D573D6|nr:hypothetical protein [Dysgonomonas sp. 216]
MKLGNTAGKNKGKKYLKIKGDEEITVENLAKSDHFKWWFGENYERLCNELKQKDTFDVDILNETFLRIYDKILYGGLDVKDYKAYFHRAFFTNYMQAVINMAKDMAASIDGVDVSDSSDDDAALTQAKACLEVDIMDYVLKKYSEKDFELFKMYVTLKPAVNYADLSVMTKMPQSRISERIGRIKKDLRSNEAFVERRKRLVKGFID